MRLFIGVELDESQRTACAAVARDLQTRWRSARVRMDVRWIPESNLHITLWFLGHMVERKAAAVQDALAIPWQRAPFAFILAGAGAFPASGPPRIVWVGVSHGADALAGVYTDLAARLEPLGFEPERRAYHPHVTIGRVRDVRPADARKVRGILAGVTVPGASADVRALTVFRSHQSPAGSRYEALLRVPLKGC